MSLKSYLSQITRYNKTTERLHKLAEKADTIIAQQQELLMAHKFHDTIADYDWLKYKGFSLTCMAIDYSLAYTISRVLNTMRPQKILECGLGQSSRIIHQYANYYNYSAITCEHDKDWVKFFLEEISNHYNINIQLFQLKEIYYNGEKTLTYKGFNERFKNEKFDFIFVDGPWGSDHYSRSQIISIAENNLDKNKFCIILHDANRPGEQESIQEVFAILDKQQIKYDYSYHQAKDDYILVFSHALKFFKTL